MFTSSLRPHRYPFSVSSVVPAARCLIHHSSIHSRLLLPPTHSCMLLSSTPRSPRLASVHAIPAISDPLHAAILSRPSPFARRIVSFRGLRCAQRSPLAMSALSSASHHRHHQRRHHNRILTYMAPMLPRRRSRNRSRDEIATLASALLVCCAVYRCTRRASGLGDIGTAVSPRLLSLLLTSALVVTPCLV
ncbi:hypothetical protein C8Q70DRAFT_595223 [Cubamyces menziesii]|nr:hypothetical protein C8Q70DRAFT_595223 [Cubamyces menziesii]